jgi:hypothetical protein
MINPLHQFAGARVRVIGRLSKAINRCCRNADAVQNL